MPELLPAFLFGLLVGVVAVVVYRRPTSAAWTVRVEILPKRAIGRAVGDTAQFSLAVYDSFGRDMPTSAVTWYTDDPTVATVDAAGLVTFLSPGETKVNANFQVDLTNTSAVRA